MKTIQITIDEELLQKVDHARQKVKMTRSQFIRKALEDVLHRLHIKELELEQVKGYCEHPVMPGEFDIWEAEQSWGNE